MTEKQKSELKYELTDRSTDELTELRNELLNVDFSHIKVPSAKIYPQWESLLQFTQLKVTDELGSEFKLSKDLSEFTLFMFPSFSFELISCILIYNMALFLFDDHLEKFPSDKETFVQQLRSKDFPGNGINEKWWRLSMKVCKEVMGETLLEQLIDHNIVSLTPELNHWTSGRSILSDEDFLELRCVDSGAPHEFFLVLIDAGLQFTDELKNDPNYLGLNKQAALQVTLINDLYSLRKEIRDETFKNNYVYVKMKNNNISAQAAVDKIILEIYESERMARMFGEKLKEKNDPNLSRYAEGMYDVMTGNHYWSTFCKRYNQYD